MSEGDGGAGGKEGGCRHWVAIDYLHFQKTRFIPEYPRVRFVLLVSGSGNRSFVVIPSSSAAIDMR